MTRRDKFFRRQTSFEEEIRQISNFIFEWGNVGNILFDRIKLKFERHQIDN